MRWAVLTLFVFLSHSQFGQLALAFHSPEGPTFQLAANGKWLNQNESDHLVISNWPQESVQLEVFLDSIRFSREIQLRGSGTHHYLLTQNYRGQWQLRYRGQYYEPEAPLERMAYQLAGDCQTCLFNKVPPVEAPSGVVLEQAKLLKESASKESASTEIAAETKTVEPIKSITAQEDQRPLVDTLALAKASPKEPSELSWFKEWQTIEYEFEKLKAAEALISREIPSDSLVVIMLKTFKYDQTRLQYLDSLFQVEPEKRFSGDLFLPHLDFELSKNTLKQKLE
jgi:hypothetical protein